MSSVKRVLAGDEELRVLLAGGLDEANVVGALREGGERVLGVDVASGVEVDGVQSLERIEAFVGAVRGFDREKGCAV